jgi:sensor histidine kinase YesM
VVIPYISTDQVFQTGLGNANIPYLVLCLFLSAVLVSIFYINYFVLIPRYLLGKMYIKYALWLTVAIVCAILIYGAVFFYSDFNPQTLEGFHPTLEKIIPVIIINATSLWMLSILLSILSALYIRLKLAESEKLSAQIASLKFQINPHFLFNTLNNIYASTIEKAPEAADMVDKLSEMMRYTMRDIQKDLVPLEDELQYITNFVELQKMRLDRSVRLEVAIPEKSPDAQIAPMLLIPFIENAFKHGVNSEQKSSISISIEFNSVELRMVVKNNKVDVHHLLRGESGLGIENTRNRLGLIYPNKHILTINDSTKEFLVSLHLNLK